jgi:hypothetical protein
MTDHYYNDYPKEPIGGRNPYYRCVHCGISDPEINGEIKNHENWCEYRIRKEHEEKQEGIMTDKPHPLTDETIEDIVYETVRDDETVRTVGVSCFVMPMRAAYDKGFNDAIECIREAGLAHYSALYEAQKDFYNKTWQLENNHD